MTRPMMMRFMMRWRSRPDPAELLAAHATGGLSPDEAAQVEAHLDEHPDARAELDAIAGAIAEVRTAEPRPADEPDWDAMAADIQRACVDSDRRWWRLGRRWTAAAVGALAVTGAISMFTRTRPARPAPDPAGLARTSPAGAAGRVETPPRASPSGLADGPASSGASGLERDEPASPGGSGAALADGRLPGLEPGDADMAEDDDPPAIDPFGSADYLPVDLMADELPDEAIDAIDRLLAEVQAG